MSRIIKTFPFEFVVMGIILFEFLVALFYDTVLWQQVIKYYNYVTIDNGVHYGLIAHNPLRYSPLILVALAVTAILIIGLFVKGCAMQGTLSIIQTVVIILAVMMVFRGFASDLFSGITNIGELKTDNKVFYLVSKQEAEYGTNNYLLACDGFMGPCNVFGPINSALVEMRFDKYNGIISLIGTTQEQQDFKINGNP